MKTPPLRASRLLEILERLGARSLCDPAMGLPTHLNGLKRHGIAVHGAETLEWLASTGNGLVTNDTTVLRDEELAAIVEPAPGAIYSTGVFQAWDGAVLGEEQCRYLAVWRQNVRALRSDAQAGLAVLGLWHVFCYWHRKAATPDAMEDVSPSELAWDYLRGVSRWVTSNGSRNTARCANALETIRTSVADVLFLHPREHYAADPRMWMWEAWWRGNPFFTLEERPPSWPALVDAAGAFPSVVILTDAGRQPEMERLLRECGRRVARLYVSESECYVIGERAGPQTAPR